MTQVDIIAIVLICLVIGGAVFYIVKEKKKGTKCIGCPYSSSCGKTCCCSESKITEKNKEK